MSPRGKVDPGVVAAEKVVCNICGEEVERADYTAHLEAKHRVPCPTCGHLMFTQKLHCAKHDTVYDPSGECEHCVAEAAPKEE